MSGKPPVVGQVPIRVILEHFRLPRHIHVTRDALPAGHRDVRPQRRIRIVDGQLLPEILSLAIRRLAVDRHRVGREACAHDVHERRHIPLRDLVQRFHAVRRRPEARATLIAPGPGLRPVANRVEAVIKLLARDGCPVGPILAGVGDLAEGVVAVNPVAAVGQRVLGALVGGVFLGTTPADCAGCCLATSRIHRQIIIAVPAQNKLINTKILYYYAPTPSRPPQPSRCPFNSTRRLSAARAGGCRRKPRPRAVRNRPAQRRIVVWPCPSNEAVPPECPS